MKNTMGTLLPLMKEKKNLGYWINEHKDEFEIFISEDKYEPIYVGSRDEFISDLMAHFEIEYRYE
jgi:hypothetical protein